MRQVLKESRLEALFLLVSNREISPTVRKAVRLRIINGYTYRLAAFNAKVTRVAVMRAVKRLIEMDRIINTYFDNKGGTSCVKK
ncbi:hypothetical protein [Photobacterium carnosum]|uniref:hypothetical protein n=1 Tax=Photobacterium carnosum TaxID=2023717 RepID=UPI002432538B|nr:hypothetical protein [Photobacterium carnosum]